MKPLLLILFSISIANAQEAASLIERLNDMTPSERQRVLNCMPRARREMLERRINNWNKIDPAAKEKLRREFALLQQLPPERQDAARRTLRQISDLPEDRRKAVRAAIHHLRQQTAEMQQRKTSSRAFRERFSEEERKLVTDAVSLLPPAQAEDPKETAH
ncbi:MAG: DUF3106 domain-containing protein [Acidobacteria bacterium]|nr:DUF3106 domain-containing protein [Acidobacteriota bacterium]